LLRRSFVGYLGIGSDVCKAIDRLGRLGAAFFKSAYQTAAFCGRRFASMQEDVVKVLALENEL